MDKKMQDEIVELIVQEKSDREIAALTGFSEDSIQKKIKKIKGVYKVKTRVGIAVEALKRAFGNDLR